MTALRVDMADLSHWQDSVDLSKARDAGLKALVHKATEDSGFVDPRFAERRKKARSIGLPFGGYAFTDPQLGTAYEQMDHFLDVAEPKAGDFMAIDVETNDNKITTDQMTTFVRSCARRLRRATGANPLLYTPYALGPMPDLLLWRARYNNDNRLPVLGADIFQFSDGVHGTPHSYPGLGNCDLNTFLKPRLRVSQFTIPQDAATADKFKLQFAPTQAQDTEAQFAHDVPLILERRSHVVAFTEVLGRKRLLADMCPAAGYDLFDPDPDSDVAFALREDLDCVSVGSIPVLGGRKKRSIEMLRIVFEDNNITICAGHWLTGYGRSDKRHSAGLSMWQGLVNAVHTAGAGHDIVLWAGDVNWDPDDASDNVPTKIMEDARLVTIYDELGVDPATLRGRTPDLIGSYALDTRVSATKVQVFNDAVDKTYIDHAQVEATYAIEPLP